MADRDKARWPWAAILGIGGLLVTDLCVAESGIDHGYVMFELVGIEWQDLTDGRRLGHEETRGYVFSTNESSPLYKAVMFCRNTMLTSKDSDAVQEVSFCETQDPDGDFTWLVSRPGPERRLEFVAGSGKYEGVSGSVRVTGGTERKDGVHMPSIETEWSFPEKRED